MRERKRSLEMIQSISFTYFLYRDGKEVNPMDDTKEISVVLRPGSLSVLFNGIEHALPKEKPKAVNGMTNRFNITFRCLKPFREGILLRQLSNLPLLLYPLCKHPPLSTSCLLYFSSLPCLWANPYLSLFFLFFLSCR